MDFLDKWLLLMLFRIACVLLVELNLVQGIDDAVTSIVNPSGSLGVQKECYDLSGVSVQSGENYVPGPDYCTVCKCEDGQSRFCRALLCQPRPDCRSFRVGASCCDFICMDDVLPSHPDSGENGGDYPVGENSLGMRMAAAILTALLAFVLLLFLVHRLRQRRLAAQQYVNAQCCHSAAYWPANDQAQLFLHGPPCPPWKPPSAVLDAPPPYTEADAQRAQLVGVAESWSATGRPGPLSPPGAPPSYCSAATAAAVLAGHSRRDSQTDVTTIRLVMDDVDRNGCNGGGGGVLPASLGPLAVQLLPTGPNTSDLREQIQRQRLNLTDHTTRTLPRHGVQQLVAVAGSGANTSHSTSDVSAVNADSNAHVLQLSAVSTLPRVTSPAGEVAERSSQQGEVKVRDTGLKVHHHHSRRHTSDVGSDNTPEDRLFEGADEHSALGDCTDSSIVRQSVMKFEAAAALEAGDILLQRCSSSGVYQDSLYPLSSSKRANMIHRSTAAAVRPQHTHQQAPYSLLGHHSVHQQLSPQQHQLQDRNGRSHHSLHSHTHSPKQHHLSLLSCPEDTLASSSEGDNLHHSGGYHQKQEVEGGASQGRRDSACTVTAGESTTGDTGRVNYVLEGAGTNPPSVGR